MRRLAIWMLGCMAASAAVAAPVPVTSYDLNNGHGVASGGAFNYWDREYSGSGSTTTDNAFLTGGTGNLTDGAVTGQNWNAVENGGGTGPYVGWRQGVLPQLSVLFNFAGPADIDTIAIHADDSAGQGGVNLPSSVTFEWGAGNSLTLPVVDPDAGIGPSWLTFSGLGIQGASSVRVGFAYANEWVFVDEVRFDGPRLLAEPSGAATMLLVALAAAGTRRRRGSAQPALPAASPAV